MFELEVHHTVAIGGVGVDTLDEMTAKWRAMPVWKKLFRRPPLMRIGKKLTVEPEAIDGAYETLDEAREAAHRKAHDLAGTIRPDSVVAIIRTEDGRVIDKLAPS